VNKYPYKIDLFLFNGFPCIIGDIPVFFLFPGIIAALLNDFFNIFDNP
jgi:hypothetical protein